MQRFAFSAAAVLLAAAVAPAAEPSRSRTIAPFSLADGAGTRWSFAEHRASKAFVVVFLGTECPVNNQYLPTLVQLHRDYAPKGVTFVGINSNVQDAATRVFAHARANGLPFPVLKDSANVVADDFAARRTPEAFVVTPERRIVYQGRIDDQIGVGFRRKAPTRRDVAVALDELLAGKPVAQPLTDAPGCLIGRVKKPSEGGTITYAKQVSRILQKRCQECHRPGQVAPMPLTSYEDALSWQEMIAEVVAERRMPPWHADPKHGTFANDRSLSAEERTTLLDWIKQGCPKGDARDLPAEKTWTRGWTIGKPDVVFEMPTAFTVPAETGPRGVAYKYFVVPTGFTEDRWVEAAEARPGAREVVHHIIVYVVDRTKLRGKDGNKPGRPTDTDLARRDGIGNGFLTAYAPGDMPLVLEPGSAKRIPKGAVLVFQMHYTPDGVERVDRSSVGLRFAAQPPKQEVRTRAIAQRFLMIPAGAEHYEAKAKATLERDVELFSLLPHLHLRGKDFTYEVVYADGKRETLLAVPRYDFNWQSTYRLATPKRLPTGARIECTAHFDNSVKNLNNPDPTKMVFWGDQTWEEMMIGFVDYSFPLARNP